MANRAKVLRANTIASRSHRTSFFSPTVGGDLVVFVILVRTFGLATRERFV